MESRKQTKESKSGFYMAAGLGMGLLTYGLWKYQTPFTQQATTILQHNQRFIIHNMRAVYLGFFGSLTGFFFAKAIEDKIPKGAYFSDLLKYASYANGVVLATGYVLTQPTAYPLMIGVGATSIYGMYKVNYNKAPVVTNDETAEQGLENWEEQWKLFIKHVNELSEGVSKLKQENEELKKVVEAGKNEIRN